MFDSTSVSLEMNYGDCTAAAAAAAGFVGSQCSNWSHQVYLQGLLLVLVRTGSDVASSPDVSCVQLSDALGIMKTRNHYHEPEAACN